MAMKWIITKDVIGDEPAVVGRGNYVGDPMALPVRFKLYDDDEELYYEGRCDEDDFDPLDWAMAHAGCTIMKTSRGGLPFEIL
jgi:hypothetical protein